MGDVSPLERPMVRILSICRTALLLLLASQLAAIAQMYPYPGRTYPTPGRGTNRAPNAGQQQPAGEPMPSFDGTVRGIDSKLLTLERPDFNTIEFNCTKKTKYFDGSKKLKASSIKAGDKILVEAKRAPDGTLDAVNIRVDHKKS
jgi:hypothetical protein